MLSLWALWKVLRFCAFSSGRFLLIYDIFPVFEGFWCVIFGGCLSFLAVFSGATKVEWFCMVLLGAAFWQCLETKQFFGSTSSIMRNPSESMNQSVVPQKIQTNDLLKKPEKIQRSSHHLCPLVRIKSFTQKANPGKHSKTATKRQIFQ